MCVVICGPAPAIPLLTAMQQRQQRTNDAAQALLNGVLRLCLVPQVPCPPPGDRVQECLCDPCIPTCSSTAGC
jgi:hypothetical protein